MDFVKAMPRHERQIVLTHGDLLLRNILVRDAKVLAILDWEMAGYFPEYWEYVKSHMVAGLRASMDARSCLGQDPDRLPGGVGLVTSYAQGLYISTMLKCVPACGR
jgi:hypothetical protein